MSVEFVRHSSTAEAWDKKFLNPRRLQCAHQPDLAATAIRGLLRCVEAACRATSADELAERVLEHILESGLAERGAFLGFKSGSGRPEVVATAFSHSSFGHLPIDRSVADYVFDRGVAVASSRSDEDGKWLLACIPLQLPGEVRVAGCLYLERLPGADPFSTECLEVLMLQGRCLMLGSSQLRADPRNAVDSSSAKPGKRPAPGPTKPVQSASGASHPGRTPQRPAASPPSRRPQPLSPTGSSRFRASTKTSWSVRAGTPESSESSKPKRIPLTIGLLFSDSVANLPDFE